jgi:methyltransferase (TIGR00027 family)
MVGETTTRSLPKHYRTGRFGRDSRGYHATGMANPISRTAYYTLGVRAADAGEPKPILGDTLAGRFMNDEARRIWEEFKSFTAPNASNAARHAMIDEHLRRALGADPAAAVVIIGAGFDTRAFRLKGGRWVEFDEPEILSYKEQCLPAASAPNPLVRVAVDFAREPLAEKLSVVGPAANVHIVIEGVLFYLTHAQRQDLLRTLAALFPRHTVYVDLMRKSFFDKYARDIHVKIAGMGATFTDMVEQPERLFLDNGYTMLDLASVPLRATEQKDIGFATFLVRWFMRTLRDGYQIGVFHRAAPR